MRRVMFGVFEFFLHLFELQHELRHGNRHRRPPVDEKRLRLPVSTDGGCYPYYTQLNGNQVVYEEDLM